MPDRSLCPSVHFGPIAVTENTGLPNACRCCGCLVSDDDVRKQRRLFMLRFQAQNQAVDFAYIVLGAFTESVFGRCVPLKVQFKRPCR